MASADTELMLDLAFDLDGEAAIYAEAGRDPVACRIVLSTEIDIVRVGDRAFKRPRQIVSALAAELTPALGGSFVLGGAVYAVNLPPVRLDDDRLVWTCDCSGALSVLYRVPTGTGATLNPPPGTNWRIAADAVAGATALRLSATLPSGQLLPGDTLNVGGAVYPVASAVSVKDPIPLATPLAAPVSSGASVALAYACDHAIPATPVGWSEIEVAAGANAANRRLLVPHASLSPFLPVPTAQHAVVFDDVSHPVQSATAIYQGGVPLVWDLTLKP
jgi:hypothetical protein